ncbi:PREDICTED: ATP-dependent RNA helicase DDX51, partial [Dufourea novaeangliae]|uniref:ATP-dependent RNA helicase DDX51 n=1 Tax=Dufourea novaeangliae TaxID=178035 RepID=UPI0007671460
IINRYEGENEKETKNEKKHLSELLQRIEERKRERAAENSQDAKEPKHERKKSKSNEFNESSVQNTSTHEVFVNNIGQQSEIENINQDSLHKKKKKKKKKNTVQVEENFVEHETNENNGEGIQNENIGDQLNEVFNKSIDSSKVQKDRDHQKDFTILGAKTKRKKHEVKRVLPDWLANPEIIPIDLNSGPSLKEFTSVLDSKLIETLKANSINKLFPVQARILSWLLKCNKDKEQGFWLRDTCVSAPTGSGKTLAYVLPIVQILQFRLVPKIRCLIVVPSQELAAQVYKVTVTYTSYTSLKVGLLSGASPIQQEQNSILKKTARGEYMSVVDIVVATPGRLIDHILKTSGFSLDDLRFLVIDEADRTADWLEYLPEHHYNIPRLTLYNLHHSKVPAQKLLFSATLSQDPEKLNRLGLFQPILFTSVLVSGNDEDVNLDKEIGDFIGRYTSPEELTERAVECVTEFKPVAVYEMLLRNDTTSKTLIFTNSGESAHRLTLLLQSFLSEKNLKVGELSAQLMPKQREGVLEKFAAGEIQILVSSDALARGVDIPNVQLVISYDLPKHIKGYIHRAGRTGRAGKSGTAISIITSKQVGIFKHMLGNAHKVIPEIEKLVLDSVANEIRYSNHVEKLKEDLENEKQTNLQRTKAVKRIQSVITE